MLRHRMFRRNERERASESVVAKLKDTLSVTVGCSSRDRSPDACMHHFHLFVLSPHSLDHHGDDHSQQLVYHPHHHLS